MISSVSNAQIKNIMKLQTKAKERNEQGVFVCEGRKMFEEARQAEHVSLKKTYVSESFYEEMTAKESGYFDGTDYEIVSESVFKQISETMTPQGVLAVVTRPKHSLEEMIKGNSGTYVVLEDVRDPGNLGTIVRTAEGAGVKGIILSRGCVDIFNPKVIRSTMGAIYRMPFVYVEDLLGTLEIMKQHDISVYAAHLEGAVFYDEVEYSKKTAIMIGNEGNGLTREAADAATSYIKIPMEGNVESLNAGIAAAVLMYEVYRQNRRR
ncbi:MAG: RNA methyltransferase [Lachnospiraceae bacterium]|nr:RNA methyltransferase [Lachnospiraceae bacterium]